MENKKNDQMYIRIGGNEMDMIMAIDLLVKAMGISAPTTPVEVAIGLQVPAGRIEALMDYVLDTEDEYPSIDIMLRLENGSCPIQMAHVEQNVVDKKNPTTYLYHRGGDIVAHMEMPTTSDAELNEPIVRTAHLVIDGGDPNFRLRVSRPEALKYTIIE